MTNAPLPRTRSLSASNSQENRIGLRLMPMRSSAAQPEKLPFKTKTRDGPLNYPTA